MYSKLYLTLLCILLTYGKLYAQNDFPQQLNSQLNKYLLDNVQEKIYIQTNSNQFYPGDTIWYKASIVNAINHKPVGNENMFYVDLISPENKLISHKLYSILDGFSDGSISLASKLKPGKYKLLAYTNYMRNFSSDFLFQKPITLISKNPDKTSWEFNSEITPVMGGDSVNVKMFAQTQNGRELNEKVDVHLQLAHGTMLGADCNIANNIGSFNFFVPDSLKMTTALLSVNSSGSEEAAKKYKINLSVQKPDIQFLPEGGDIVADQENRIAFRCVDTNGNPVNVQGKIVSPDENSLASFSTEYDGMGSFNLLAKAKQKYVAQVNYLDSLFTYTLPAVKEEAYSLKLIKQESDSILFTIIKSGDATPNFLLIGNCRGSIKFMTKGIMDKNSVAVNIPTEKFPDGILTLTLFINEKPRAERLVYIDKKDNFDFNLEAQETWENDSTTNYILELTSQDGTPVNGNFSLTGWNSKMENSLDSLENIRNYLLFSSDLQGETLANTSLFDPTNGSSTHLKDLMLMTYGWRRFKWDDITQYKEQEHPFKTEKDFYLRGNIHRRFSDKPAPKNTDISIVLKQPNAVHIDKAIIDENGDFYVTLPAFSDSASLIFQTKNRREKARDYVLDINTNLEKFHINSLDFDKVSKREFSPLVRNQPSLSEIVNSEKKDSLPVEYKYSLAPITKRARVDNYYFPGKDTIMIEEVEDSLKNNQKITISSPGYKTKELEILSTPDSLICIKLVKAKVVQPENKTEAVKIVRKSIAKSRNLYNTKTSLQGYNRETVTIDNNVYGIYETGFNYYNTGLPGTEYTIRFGTIKFRNMEDKGSNKLMVLQPNHRCLFYPLKRDVIASPIKFWDMESLEYFDFKLIGQIEYDGELCYKIRFQQKDNLLLTLQNGILYIGEKSEALRYASWSTTPDKRKFVSYTDYLQSNPMNYDVQLTDDYNEVSYSLINKQLYLQASNQQINVLVNGQNDLKFNSRLSIGSEIK